MFRGAFSGFGRAGRSGSRRWFHRSWAAQLEQKQMKASSLWISDTISFVKKWPIVLVPVGAGLYFLWPQGKKAAPETQKESIPQGASHSTPPPGGSVPLSTRVLEAGASLAQSFDQLKNISSVLNGIHFYNGNLKRQVESWHLCSHLNDDFKQCLIYDGPGKDARLIGVEYIISERLFDQLPEHEKVLWHSHAYEVKSGLLVAPGVPEMAERQLMKDVARSYGKTWHLWQVDRGDVLPVGGPRLMMSFTQDGQLDPQLLEHRDHALHISSAEKRSARVGIEAPVRIRGADAWEGGDIVQCQLQYT